MTTPGQMPAQTGIGVNTLRFILELHAQGNRGNQRTCGQIWHAMTRNGDMRMDVIRLVVRGLEDEGYARVSWKNPEARNQYDYLELLPAARSLFPVGHSCIASSCMGMYTSGLGQLDIPNLDISIGAVALMMRLHHNGNVGDELLCEATWNDLIGSGYHHPNMGPMVLARMQRLGYIQVAWPDQQLTPQLTQLQLLPEVDRGVLPPGHVFDGSCCRPLAA